MPKCFLFWLIFSSYQCHLEASEAKFERQWICSSFLNKPTQFFIFIKSQRDKKKYIVFQYLGYYLSTHLWKPFQSIWIFNRLFEWLLFKVLKTHPKLSWISLVALSEAKSTDTMGVWHCTIEKRVWYLFTAFQFSQKLLKLCS